MSDPVQVPDGWKSKQLGEIADIIMGQSPPSSTYNTSREGLPFYQGKADFGAKYSVTRFWCSEPAKVAPSNAILFSVRAPVGDVNLTIGECCIGRGLSAILGTKAENNFLYQYIQHFKSDFLLLSQGSTFEAINGTELKQFPVSLPPLPEQKKIASILTSVDDVIEKTEAQISKLQDLKKGMMTELLTKGIGHTEFNDSPVGRIPRSWEVVDLLDVINIQNGQVDPRIEPYKSMILVAPNHVESNTGRLIEKSTADCQSAISGKYFCPLNTVIYSKIRPKLKKAVLVNFECICSADMYPFICTDKITPIFLYNTILDERFSNFASTVSERSNIPKINRIELKEFLLALPPVTEQDRICEIITSIHKNIESKQTRLRKTKALKKALMNDLLTGKVRV